MIIFFAISYIFTCTVVINTIHSEKAAESCIGLISYIINTIAFIIVLTKISGFFSYTIAFFILITCLNIDAGRQNFDIVTITNILLLISLIIKALL